MVNYLSVDRVLMKFKLDLRVLIFVRKQLLKPLISITDMSRRKEIFYMTKDEEECCTGCLKNAFEAII